MVKCLAVMYSFIKADVPVSTLTTFEIGGPARWLAEPSNLEELKQSILFAREHALDVFPIGCGSNILASDAGFKGLLIKPKMQKLTVTIKDEEATVEAQAGVIWDDLVAQTVEKDLAGLECLSGIPGQVGAAPVQNIGAYGQEAGTTIESVQVVDLETLETLSLSAASCAFAYRTSNFKTAWKGRYIITSVTFKLKVHGQATMRYQDLERFFADKVATDSTWRPTLAQVRQAVLKVRASKSMLYDKADPNHRCAGSFYLNPVISQAQAQQLKERWPNMPVYNTDNPDMCKVSAAWLVDNAGFHKGFRYGKAGVSSAHTLALINPGQASAVDMLAFSELVKAKVKEVFNIQLKPEPIMLGFSEH